MNKERKEERQNERKEREEPKKSSSIINTFKKATLHWTCAHSQI